MNGNRLPMAYCLAHQGLMQAHNPVFSEEVEAGKKIHIFSTHSVSTYLCFSIVKI
jgi:hypothetical protein